MEAARRAYQLRLARLDVPNLRESAARWVEARLPSTDLAALRRALGGPGFAMRLELTEPEAPGVLRELYALGLPPSAVALVPLPVKPPDRDTGRRMAVFETRGGRFVPTWNWSAFFFGPLWYLKRGLWAKGLVLLALTLVPVGTLGTTLAVSLVALAYCGSVGNWDEYLWRVKHRQWW